MAIIEKEYLPITASHFPNFVTTNVEDKRYIAIQAQLHKSVAI